jgi:hypothetical protein
MTEPSGFADDGVNPCIVLAGKKWPIPMLGPRQNRVVVEAVRHVTKRMREIAEAKLATLDPATKAALLASVDPGILGQDAALRQKLWAVTDFSVEMTNEMDAALFDNISNAVFWALKKAHPEMPREEFEDMPIGMLELIDCIGVVAQQTGMMRRVDPRADPLAPAGSNRSPSSPTGTS